MQCFECLLCCNDWYSSSGTQLVEYPPYLPNLAPGDYLLFPKLKERENVSIDNNMSVIIEWFKEV